MSHRRQYGEQSKGTDLFSRGSPSPAILDLPVSNGGDSLGKGFVTCELTALDGGPNQLPLARWNRILQEFAVSLAPCRLVRCQPLKARIQIEDSGLRVS